MQQISERYAVSLGCPARARECLEPCKAIKDIGGSGTLKFYTYQPIATNRKVAVMLSDFGRRIYLV